MAKKTNSSAIYQDLIKNVKGKKGSIAFSLAGVDLVVKNKDTVGKTLQEWLKIYLKSQDYFFEEPENTQTFPDFFLSEDKTENLLEIKSFNYSKSPAFDIANFNSYCNKIMNDPYCLYADYLIFGYEMEDEVISIEDIWLKKVWEIAGTSERFPLKTQFKNGFIENIRPNTTFKKNEKSGFLDEKSFLKALFLTICMYKGKSIAEDWKNNFCENYENHYDKSIEF